jgi:hypothetical protein
MAAQYYYFASTNQRLQFADSSGPYADNRGSLTYYQESSQPFCKEDGTNTQFLSPASYLKQWMVAGATPLVHPLHLKETEMLKRSISLMSSNRGLYYCCSLDCLNFQALK